MCKQLLLCLFYLAPSILAWQPIAGPSAPATAYSLEQAHPTGLGDIGGSAESEARIITGNKFLEQNLDAPDFTSNDAAYRYFGHSVVPIESECSVEKFAFEHEGTVEYKNAKIPKLDQFTLCTWMRFSNHSGDHSMFTYSVEDSPREIQFWIANTKDASWISLAVHGQSLFRLNYPVKLRVWHHACASWNGKTGEWQLWVKAERVGRGFHNRLIGHELDPNGRAYSGGPSITGKIADNLHMEVTMVQLYKVALSAGKAHRDHKHHHVHQFNHDGLAPTTPRAPLPTPPPPPPQQPTNTVLANGQIATRLRINFAGQQPQQPAAPAFPQQPPPPMVTTNFVRGQFSTAARYLTQQLAGLPTPQGQPQYSSLQQFGPTSFADISNPANVKFIDGNDNAQHILFKRGDDSKKVEKRETTKKKQQKRGLIMLNDGSVVDDSLLGGNSAEYDFDGLAQFGAPVFKENLSKYMDIEDEIKEHDREPAEGEVQAVLNLCSTCETEPFIGAIVMAWKDIRVQSIGSISAKSRGGCGQF